MKQLQVAILFLSCLATVLLSQTVWTTRVSDTTLRLTAVAYCNTTYIAVAQSGIMLTSPGGITWTTIHQFDSIVTPWSNYACCDLYNAAYGNNMYCVVGVCSSGDPFVATSSDGVKFKGTYSATGSGSWPIFGVTYGNNTFVTVGTYGIIRTSSDGTSWPLATSATQNVLYSVTYGNNTFVTVGVKGMICTSPNGTTWTICTSGTTNYLKGVTYGNNMFVAVGDSGMICTSPNGTTWTICTSGTTNYLKGVTYGNNMYVAVGDSGRVLTSPDGITWTSRVSGITACLYSVTYGNNMFVAVSRSGTILTSPAASPITYTAPKWSYSLTGNTMQIYNLQGKLISQKKIESDNYFDSKSSIYNNLSKGVYIARIPFSNISRRVLIK
jgi:hypothetical protein